MQLPVLLRSLLPHLGPTDPRWIRRLGSCHFGRGFIGSSITSSPWTLHHLLFPKPANCRGNNRFSLKSTSSKSSDKPTSSKDHTRPISKPLPYPIPHPLASSLPPTLPCSISPPIPSAISTPISNCPITPSVPHPIPQTLSNLLSR